MLVDKRRPVESWLNILIWAQCHVHKKRFIKLLKQQLRSQACRAFGGSVNWIWMVASELQQVIFHVGDDHHDNDDDSL